MERTDPWECVIVGGGAAGLSAAMTLGRARRRTLVVDAGEQSNRAAHGIGGLLGHDGRPPAELYALGREELRRYPTVTVRDASVRTAERSDDGFVLTLEGDEQVAARRLVLATGMRYAVPELPGVDAFWGGAVFHCPYCHGWDVRDGRLAVHGADHAVHRALLLRCWSPDVVVLTDGGALSDDDRETLRVAGVAVDDRRVAGLRGTDGTLEAARFADGDERPLDGILVLAPLHQRHDLATGLGAALGERGAVDVDMVGQTTVLGLYAAGDAGAMMPNVAGAIADGVRAGAAVNDALIALEHGVPPMMPRRGVPARD
ncbi:NAD(P)/FAD-dependent oxidoreductase [Patulibacter minatonensis]|uniref:NAD(P)/FAD-dependent oxidoreductase n=1 Tax=Patulibacter minatonensis TaxID=298163 RepID=UPI000560FB3E|nr:NAD(P)/FAD-dependent oxidoreductase [Patulibacter minatonensis]